MSTNNSINSNIPIEISKGGTNATSMATSTGIVKYDGTRLVTSSTALIDSSNRQTNSSQPYFLVYLANQQSNATGNNVLATVNFDTKIKDVGTNFSSNTFTAPITGNYFLSANVLALSSTKLQTLMRILIVTTAQTFESNVGDLLGMTPSTGQVALMCTVIAPMTAGDTAIVQSQISGSTQSVSFYGQAAPPVFTYFTGYLVC